MTVTGTTVFEQLIALTAVFWPALSGTDRTDKVCVAGVSLLQTQAAVANGCARAKTVPIKPAGIMPTGMPGGMTGPMPDGMPGGLGVMIGGMPAGMDGGMPGAMPGGGFGGMPGGAPSSLLALGAGDCTPNADF